MPNIYFQTFFQLLRFDFYRSRGDFHLLVQKVRNYPVAPKSPAPDICQLVCSAVDLVCVWYWMEVLCLQRSAATVCLLRKYGNPATLVIGAQHMPFRAHAWVELDGVILNDKPYVPEIYAVLERC